VIFSVGVGPVPAGPPPHLAPAPGAAGAAAAFRND